MPALACVPPADLTHDPFPHPWSRGGPAMDHLQTRLDALERFALG